MVNSFLDFAGDKRVLDQVREVFFESSAKKTFSSSVEKEEFFHKWLGVYLERFPKFALVYTEDINGSPKVLGYIVCCPNSREFEQQQFSQFFDEYPAHLHINCHMDARGKGVGTQLIVALEDCLTKREVSGLHLITAAGARNVGFYLKNKYELLGTNTQGEIQTQIYGKRLK